MDRQYPAPPDRPIEYRVEHAKPERNLDIYRAFMRGLTYREIGDEHGISRVRCCQVVQHIRKAILGES